MHGASHQLTGHKVRSVLSRHAAVWRQPELHKQCVLNKACMGWTEHSMHARHEFNIACMHACIVKVYNLNAGGASHQLTGHKVRRWALLFVPS
jgi:hypothetical protein